MYGTAREMSHPYVETSAHTYEFENIHTYANYKNLFMNNQP